MKQKHYYLLKGWLYLAAVVIVPVIIVSEGNLKEMDTFGIVAGSTLLLFMSFMSYNSFKRAKKYV